MDATGLHVLNHLFGTHVASTAIAMRHHHHIGYTQFEDSHQQTANHTTEGVRNNPSRILDHLHVSVLDAESSRKQGRQSGIHTRENRYLLVGIFIRDELLVAFIGYKFLVILQDFVYHSHYTFKMFMDNKLQGKKILFKNKRFFLRFSHFCLFPRNLAKLLALLSPELNSLCYKRKRVAGVLPPSCNLATEKFFSPL